MVRGGPPSSREGPLLARSALRRKYFLCKRDPPSFNTGGPSVGHRTIVRSEGALRISEGALCQSEGALHLAEGPSVGQISPPPVKKYFLGQRVPPSFNTRRPSSVVGPSVGHRGALHLSEGALSWSEGALSWSDWPSVRQKYFLGQRGSPSFNRSLLSV